MLLLVFCSFVLQVPELARVWTISSLTILCIISWRCQWERMISHITASKTKSCMVQTRSMATINQEIGNPSNALERKVQTLAVIVKWLTQRNQELAEQLNQRNE